ncbi:MAG: bifunctional riboflavin kinase/FAD synthetase [Candidatus Rariloculaceae bacterium]
MYLYRDLNSLKRTGRIARVITVGAYDGLHLGHQEILRRLVELGREADLSTLVMSFEPMPKEFFSPVNPPARLTRFRERMDLLAKFGVDEFFCPRFDNIRDLSPNRFIRELLIDGLNANHVVVGHDFRFASHRLGSLQDLNAAGRANGFEVTAIPAVYLDDERISSTVIRAALQTGDLDTASRMLGRNYSMSGTVIRGLGLGRNLGFPTANVNLNRRVTPVDGIFAARVGGIGDEMLDGVASVGTRPTVGGVKPLLEVFIFGFDRDIYGEYITVHFVKRLREERKYSDVDSMVAQMHSDVVDARAVLAA